MMMFLPSCLDMSRRYARGELESASWFFRLLVRMHLAMCKHCGRYMSQIKLLGEAIRRKSSSDLSRARVDELEERILKRIQA